MYGWDILWGISKLPFEIWNSSQNILPIHKKKYVIFKGKILGIPPQAETWLSMSLNEIKVINHVSKKGPMSQMWA